MAIGLGGGPVLFISDVSPTGQPRVVDKSPRSILTLPVGAHRRNIAVFIRVAVELRPAFIVDTDGTIFAVGFRRQFGAAKGAFAVTVAVVSLYGRTYWRCRCPGWWW